MKALTVLKTFFDQAFHGRYRAASGWTVSVLIHSLAALTAMAVVADIKIPPKEQLTWEVSMVEPPPPKKTPKQLTEQPKVVERHERQEPIERTPVQEKRPEVSKPVQTAAEQTRRRTEQKPLNKQVQDKPPQQATRKHVKQIPVEQPSHVTAQRKQARPQQQKSAETAPAESRKLASRQTARSHSQPVEQTVRSAVETTSTQPQTRRTTVAQPSPREEQTRVASRRVHSAQPQQTSAMEKPSPLQVEAASRQHEVEAYSPTNRRQAATRVVQSSELSENGHRPTRKPVRAQTPPSQTKKPRRSKATRTEQEPNRSPANSRQAVRTIPASTRSTASDSRPINQPISKDQVATRQARTLESSRELRRLVQTSPLREVVRKAAPEVARERSVNQQRIASLSPQQIEKPEALERAAPSTSSLQQDYDWLMDLLWDQIDRLKRYPFRARTNGWEGKVVLWAVVTDEGEITDLGVQESSGYPILDKDAVETLKLASPLTLPHSLGKPQVTVQLQMRYELE